MSNPKYYSMSNGVNKPLVDFTAPSDAVAFGRAVGVGAEYCVRLDAKQCMMYTVLEYGWQTK